MPDKAGKDFNDILEKEGVLGVRNLIKRQISGHELLQNPEACKQFNGDNADAIFRSSNQVREAPQPTNVTINAPYRPTAAQKQLVLER